MEKIDLEELKANNPILDVAAKLGFNVRKQSGTVAVNCIFHTPDNHPSLVLMSDVNYFECKSCDAKGDVVDFVQKALGTDFNGAVEWLGGSTNPKNNFESSRKSGLEADPYRRETYFDDHGINLETQKKFNLHLGYFKDIPTAVIPNDKGKHHRCFGGDNKFLTEGKVTLFKADEPNG